MNACGIYRIVSPSGKFYVGSAELISKRWNQHRHLLRAGRHHNKPLQAAYSKYGDLSFEVLLICERSDLLMYEQRAIDVLHPEYNILRVAGRVVGYEHSEETRRKLSIAHTGRSLSDEHRRRIGESTKEFFRNNPESRAKIGRAHAGKVTSDATKALMSDAQKRQWSNKSEEQLKAAKERMSGENSPVCKLTWEIVRAIRREHAESGGRKGIQKELCAKYNVSPGSMCQIIKRQQWIE
jgi:group I intron endonuclease